MSVPEGLLEVGRIGRPHGVRGDVFIDLTTDRTERVAVGARLFARNRWYTIVQSSRSNQRWRVHFEGVDDLLPFSPKDYVDAIFQEKW